MRFKSRKLLAFSIWSIMGIILFIIKGPIDVFIPYYGLITAIYIGGQSTIDAIEKMRK